MVLSYFGICVFQFEPCHCMASLAASSEKRLSPLRRAFQSFSRRNGVRHGVACLQSAVHVLCFYASHSFQPPSSPILKSGRRLEDCRSPQPGAWPLILRIREASWSACSPLPLSRIFPQPTTQNPQPTTPPLRITALPFVPAWRWDIFRSHRAAREDWNSG
jgi:hypothetical protein